VKIHAILPWVAIAGLSLGSAAMAQNNNAGGSQGGSSTAASSQMAGKVAVVDINAAIVSTAEGKAAYAELQSKFAPQNKEMDDMRKSIDSIDKQLAAGSNTLSDDEKQRLTRQEEILSHQLQNRQQEFQEEATAAQNDVLNRIGQKMMDVLQTYGRENALALVVSSSNTTPTVLYKAPQLDITEDIVKLYDTKYPVKASASAPPPKPSTPASTPVKKPGGGPGGQN
jgi:Skp family chaperone for outer membrane proteins